MKQKRERPVRDPISGDIINATDRVSDEAVFITDEVVYAHNQKSAREAYHSVYGRRLNDADVREYFQQLVAGAVSCDDDSFKVPTWVGVAVTVVIKGAKKAHGREPIGSRVKMVLENFGRSRQERDAVREAEALWVELKAQKKADQNAEAAKRAKKKHPHLEISPTTLMRRMRLA